MYGGSTLTNDESAEVNNLGLTAVAVVSTLLDGSSNAVSRSMHDMSTDIATPEVGEAIARDFTSTASNIFGSITGSLDCGQSVSVAVPSASNSAFAFQLSTGSTSPPSSSTLVPAISYVASMTPAPCCESQSTVTCTVTETWHSTHYDSTATLYSFLNDLTVTETIKCVGCPNFGFLWLTC